MSFVYPHVSLIAIIAAAVWQFVLGFLWYAPFTPTGRTWASYQTIPEGAKPGLEMIAFPVGSLFAAWATAVVYAWSGAHGLIEGALVGLVLAVAVGVQVLTTAVADNKLVPSLLAVNLGYVLIAYVGSGKIIGLLS